MVMEAIGDGLKYGCQLAVDATGYVGGALKGTNLSKTILRHEYAKDFFKVVKPASESVVGQTIAPAVGGAVSGWYAAHGCGRLLRGNVTGFLAKEAISAGVALPTLWLTNRNDYAPFTIGFATGFSAAALNRIVSSFRHNDSNWGETPWSALSPASAKSSKNEGKKTN